MPMDCVMLPTTQKQITNNFPTVVTEMGKLYRHESNTPPTTMHQYATH